MVRWCLGGEGEWSEEEKAKGTKGFLLYFENGMILVGRDKNNNKMLIEKNKLPLSQLSKDRKRKRRWIPEKRAKQTG